MKINVEDIKGLSVTNFIKKVYMPVGGYLEINNFNKQNYYDGKLLSDKENITPSSIGLVVDYMTRFLMTGDAYESFHISLDGAMRVKEYQHALDLVNRITGLNSNSIKIACELVRYDEASRASPSAYVRERNVVPDGKTIRNIKILVSRTIDFFKDKNLISSHVVFIGAYTNRIQTGDADFLTDTTLWDLKVSRFQPSNENILQLLIYQLLLYKSYCEIFSNIGIFNPRLNCSYEYDMLGLSSSIFDCVDSLIENRCIIRSNDYIIGDEITAISICPREDTSNYVTVQTLDVLIENIINGSIIADDDLYYTAISVKIDDIVGNILIGSIVRSSYKRLIFKNSRSVNRSIWECDKIQFFEYDSFINKFINKGLTKKDIFNNFGKLRYIKNIVS